MTTFLTDRTSIETDWKCGTKLWWYKYEDGEGIVPAVEPDALKQGGDIHADLAFLADAAPTSEELVERMGAIPTSLGDAEVWARRLGWLVAWNGFIEPGIRERYNTILLEQELVLDRDPLFIATTPDRVIEERGNEEIVYVDDYKSFASWDTTKWATHWPYAIQMHIQIAAVQEELERKVTCGRVRGLFKGSIKEDKLRHPYVYAYSNGTGWQLDWKSGWDLRPTWEYPGGILAWVRGLGDEVARSQFPFSQPIFLNAPLLERMLLSEEARQEEISSFLPEARENLFTRDMIFRPHFSECKPVIGNACPYLACCHNATVGDDPLASGLYVRRTPHHELELISRDGGDDEANVD